MTSARSGDASQTPVWGSPARSYVRSACLDGGRVHDRQGTIPG